jgi:hypothetical protein
MIDLSLIITIGVIFSFSLVGAYLRSRARDRCLKSWEGFHATLERTSGKLIWGVMHIAPAGMELSYLDSVQDEKHLESSYLLYTSEYGEIQALNRYVEQLSEWGQKRRARDIERSFHPGPMRRFRRSAQNFLGTATDSGNEVFGLVLGRVQKAGGRYFARPCAQNTRCPMAGAGCECSFVRSNDADKGWGSMCKAPFKPKIRSSTTSFRRSDKT